MFYKGVVEDNADPLKLGRVRVRIFGVHPISTSQVPTSALPWATVDSPTIFGGLHQGVGISSILHQGTWVRLFFETQDDLEVYEKPVVFSVIPGIVTSKDTGLGFGDPSGTYPTAVGVADVSGLLTGGTRPGTVYPEAEEPPTPSTYGGNYMFSTSSGHMFEMDDSPGSARLCLFHKSGSYIEIKDAGNLIEKIINDKLQIILGNYTSFIDGNSTNKVKGNVDTTILGNDNIDITGNNTMSITGNNTTSITGDDTISVTGNSKINVTGNNTVDVAGNNTVTISGSNSISTSGSSVSTISGSNTENISGDKKISAAMIMLN